MLLAILYQFAKKENSTARPVTSTPSITLNIIINDGDSSILSPSIRIPTAQSGIPSSSRLFDYNYAYIADFKRYYYITDWTYNADGTWTASCRVDVLATWKNEIMSSPGYVGRSTNHSDPYIQDLFYPSRNTPVTIRDNAATGFFPATGTGTFVLGVNSAKTPTQGTDNGNLGSVSYYMMSVTEFASMTRSLLGIYNADGNIFTPDWKTVDDGQFKSDAWKSMNTPMEYISSCKFYPVTLIPHTANPEQIVAGGWAIGGQGGYKLTRLYDESSWRSIPITNVDHIPIPDTNPVQYYDYNPDDYPTYEPYANYILQSPWGEYPLDANIMSVILRRQSPTLYWKIIINYSTGMGTLVVTDSPAGTFPESKTITTTHELIRTEIKVGTDVALQSIEVDELFGIKAISSIWQSFNGIANGVFQAVASGFGGNIGGIGSGATSALNSTIDMGVGIVDAMRGGQRTAMGGTMTESNNTPLITQISVQQTRYSTVGRSPEMFGKPLKQHVSNLLSYDGTPFTGFVQMDYSEFNAPCTDTERGDVIAWLRGGVLLE